MPNLALFTAGVLQNSADKQEFFTLATEIFQTAQKTPGLVYLAPPQLDPKLARAQHLKNLYPPHKIFQTLTVWENLQHAHNFSYLGIHGQALKERRKWFIEGDWPTHVLWWTEKRNPFHEKGCERWELLRANGPTQEAFNFHQPFDAEGTALRHI